MNFHRFVVSFFCSNLTINHATKDLRMIKKLLATSIYLFSISGFSCTNAQPTDSINFCSTFKAAATCYCTASGLPASMCQNMKVLNARMIIVFGSLQKACEYQHYTSTQDCINNWNCYLQGGKDSNGKLCSSTQRPCE